MTMEENARLILGLRYKGWTDTEIVDFLLWIESGEEQYKPKQEEEAGECPRPFCFARPKIIFCKCKNRA